MSKLSKIEAKVMPSTDECDYFLSNYDVTYNSNLSEKDRLNNLIARCIEEGDKNFNNLNREEAHVWYLCAIYLSMDTKRDKLRNHWLGESKTDRHDIRENCVCSKFNLCLNILPQYEDFKEEYMYYYSVLTRDMVIRLEYILEDHVYGYNGNVNKFHLEYLISLYTTYNIEDEEFKKFIEKALNDTNIEYVIDAYSNAIKSRRVETNYDGYLLSKYLGIGVKFKYNSKGVDAINGIRKWKSEGNKAIASFDNEHITVEQALKECCESNKTLMGNECDMWYQLPTYTYRNMLRKVNEDISANKDVNSYHINKIIEYILNKKCRVSDLVPEEKVLIEREGEEFYQQFNKLGNGYKFDSENYLVIANNFNFEVDTMVHIYNHASDRLLSIDNGKYYKYIRELVLKDYSRTKDLSDLISRINEEVFKEDDNLIKYVWSEIDEEYKRTNNLADYVNNTLSMKETSITVSAQESDKREAIIKDVAKSKFYKEPSIELLQYYYYDKQPTIEEVINIVINLAKQNSYDVVAQQLAGQVYYLEAKSYAHGIQYQFDINDIKEVKAVDKLKEKIIKFVTERNELKELVSGIDTDRSYKYCKSGAALGNQYCEAEMKEVNKRNEILKSCR